MSGLSRIALEDVGHTWRGRIGDRTVLSGVTLTIEPGDFVTISGASGAGKTTLLTVLGGLTRPTEGRVFFGDEYAWSLPEKSLAELRGESLAFVFQHADLIASLSALHNVALPLIVRRVPAEKALSRAGDALESMGLGDKARSLPRELSGGERRRVALARAFAVEPTFVLADEPTGDLDPLAAASVIEALTALRNRGCGIVVVTHDEAIASAGIRRLRLDNGRISDG